MKKRFGYGAGFLFLLGLVAWWGYHGERRKMVAAGSRESGWRPWVTRMRTSADQRSVLDDLEAWRQQIGQRELSEREREGLWKRIRAFSLEQVEAALSSLPKGTPWEVNGVLAAMLSYRWAQMDPMGAAEDAEKALVAEFGTVSAEAPTVGAARSEMGMRMMAVLSAWAEVDGEAMVRWARASQAPGVDFCASEMVSEKWLVEDPRNGLARVREAFGEMSWRSLSKVIENCGGEAEYRQAILKALAMDGSTQGWNEYGRGLTAHLDPVSPDLAMQMADEMTSAGAPSEVVQAFEGGWREEYLLRFGSDTEDVAALWASLSPEQWQSELKRLLFAQGAVSDPRFEEALEWAESRGEVAWVASTTQDYTTWFLHHGGWASPEHPSVKNIQEQFKSWERMDPESAQRWRSGLPVEMREVLQP
ncbi:hypothetical protein HNR46_003080 [Haloferula luteola]|uniref:Uncharacterized protein n=1 Tax=Haloferula luteola TaxID=595692 RepID=A0A840V4B6_9BACT|nr:hypothetical protein [Haloferula luteola]MBB5352832.1 hypothetical protein [Haloferula luteola]